jgi:hypothetical protein
MARTTQANGSRLFRASGIVVALVIAAVPSSLLNAQPTDRRDRQIDGTSAASFERSVAQLQSKLSQRRRDEFELALAIIWISNTADPTDVDRDADADVDVLDIRKMKEDALDLLTDIRRGNLVSAVENRAKKEDDYTAADYFKQLDGLGYHEVLDLADRPDMEPYAAALRRERNARTLATWCDRGVIHGNDLADLERRRYCSSFGHR